jgi:2,3-bisphosphoglycerate-dependent phosphoglycerate mutase
MSTLVLLRHGESEWNRDNRFTGWTDVDLTDRGRRQALAAGRTLRDEGFEVDVAYTSVLKRAIRTLWIALDAMDRMWVPVHTCWRLNERHYGALQGLDKAETGAKFEKDQLRQWRRSFEGLPPKLDVSDSRYPGHERRYKHLRPDEIPFGESLRDTASRLWPCWQHSISVALRERKNVLVVAHGNTLRAVVKYLDGISDIDIADLEIPMGVPLVYDLDTDLLPTEKYYLQTAQENKVATTDTTTVTILQS